MAKIRNLWFCEGKCLFAFVFKFSVNKFSHPLYACTLINLLLFRLIITGKLTSSSYKACQCIKFCPNLIGIEFKLTTKKLIWIRLSQIRFKPIWIRTQKIEYPIWFIKPIQNTNIPTQQFIPWKLKTGQKIIDQIKIGFFFFGWISWIKIEQIIRSN